MKSNKARRKWVAAFHIRSWTALEQNNSIKKELPCNTLAQVEHNPNFGHKDKNSF